MEEPSPISQEALKTTALIDAIAKVPQIVETIAKIPDKLAHVADKNAENAAQHEQYMAAINKRRQYASYGIIAAIILSVSALTYHGSIDGAATAGILGIIVGHIFSRVNTGDR